MIYLIGYFNEFCHYLQMKPSVPDVTLKNMIKKQKNGAKTQKKLNFIKTLEYY